MGYTVTSTTAPTIASSDEDVDATINGSLLGLTRIGSGQQAAAGDMVRLFGSIEVVSTLVGAVTLTIPLPYMAAAAPLCCQATAGAREFAFALNSDETAVEVTFTAASETFTADIAFEFMTATANT